MTLTRCLLLSLLLSCAGKPDKSDAGQTPPEKAGAVDSTSTTAEYFPVRAYLQSEVRDVDSLPVGIKKYVTQNGRTDSAYIKAEEFHELSNQFINDELSDPSFKSNFKETSFFDRSTNTSTFLYTPVHPESRIQRVDVLSVPGDVYDKVKSIFIHKSFQSKDTTFNQKLYWSAGKSFQINTEWKTGDRTGTTLVKVVWDNM